MLVRNRYGFLLGGLVWLGTASAQPATTGAQAWNPQRTPPLVQLELVSSGHQEVRRTLIGIYRDERVCYLESVQVGGAILRFARGTETPLPGQASSWAAAVAETIRSLPETKAVLLHGHAEPTELSTPAQAVALSQHRAEVARALLIEHGIASGRLQVRAHGSAESALLPGDSPNRAADWRRVSVQSAEEQSPHGARLIRQRGDQRALLGWLLAAHQASAQHLGTEPFEVGHHVPRLSLKFQEAALARLGRLPPDPARRPADTKSIARFVAEMALGECRESH